MRFLGRVADPLSHMKLNILRCVMAVELNCWRLILLLLAITVCTNISSVLSDGYESYNDALRNNRGKLLCNVCI